MQEEEATVAMSGQTISDTPNGESTMSIGEASRQIQEAAAMANRSALGVIPNQVNHNPRRRPVPSQQGPVAQYSAYQQPPVNQVQRVAPSQMVAPGVGYPQRPAPTAQYYPSQPYYQQQQWQSGGYAPYYPQQPQMQQPPSMAPAMSDGFGAPFSEMYVTNDKTYECYVDLPGVNPGDIKVRVVQNSLEVSGVRKLHSESPTAGKKNRRVKVVAAQSSVPSYLLNHFKFTFPFGKPVDEDDVKAVVENGQLHVTIAILSSEKGVNVNVTI